MAILTKSPTEAEPVLASPLASPSHHPLQQTSRTSYIFGRNLKTLLLNGYSWNKHKESRGFSTPKRWRTTQGFKQQGREETRKKRGLLSSQPFRSHRFSHPLNTLKLPFLALSLLSRTHSVSLWIWILPISTPNYMYSEVINIVVRDEKNGEK